MKSSNVWQKAFSFLILIVMSPSFFSSCASSSKKSPEPSLAEDPSLATTQPQAQLWSARLQVENLETEKKERVDLDVMAQRPSNLRMEVKGTFGVVGALGSLQQNVVTLVLPRQKKAYRGEAGPESLKSFLHIPLDPRILIPLFFDETIAGWSCNGETDIQQCTKGELKVQILERNEAKRRIQLSGPTFIATLIIRPLGTKVLDQKDVFQLDVPEGYKTYKLP